ncbi:hypothetical protein JCM9140_941 [Halalkalibacter wakoensis JCM 9140]|uniref:Sortilin N-terminal domain-containing protein n=2 Tax=Halalkalibacter wakoensis TaxID=127891 RepID=W4Q0T4_9BACI|nr:hypothetical protein JCM9140_941 [Halalkalibacter wakoensis JCM 9140]
MHVHGLEFDHSGDRFYVATHHGLIDVSEKGWYKVGKDEEQHDLMGFTILQDGKMISSGHPSHKSDLENPLGVIVSEDKGESWTPIALHGEVDFHVLHVNKRNENIMYGIDSYHSELYKSVDGGDQWDQVVTEGLPGSVGEVYALTTRLENPDVLLAGTEFGLFISEDGGLKWDEYQKDFIATAFEYVNESELLLAYFIGEKEGLHVSDDFGQTWVSMNLQLEEDAVTYISVHPFNDDEIIVGTVQQSVYRTTDLGRNWEVLATEGEPNQAYHPNNET